MNLGRILFGWTLTSLCFLSGGAWAQVITEFTSGIGTGTFPFGITAGPDGNLWFTKPAGAIGRITTAGVVTEYSSGLTFGSPGGYGAGNGITAGPDGNLWFTEVVADRIGKITTAGIITEYSIGSSVQPNEITAGPDGNLWFTEVSGGIGKITTAGVVTEYSSGISADGRPPFHITAGPDGNLWFTEAGADRIGKITTAGVVTEYSSGISAGATLVGITAGPDSNLWFTEFGGNRIGKITTAGVVTEYSSGITPGAGLGGITAGPDGNLWFAEAGGRIGKITTAGVVAEYSSGISAGAQPNEITAGPDGNLWFTEFGADRIGRITTGAAIAPQAGLWWNPAESGTGYSLDYKHGVLVVTVYSYTVSGSPIWYLASGPVTNNTFTSTLDKYQNGQCISCAYQPPTINGNDGTISITFTSSTSAMMTLPGGRNFQIVPEDF
jgi:virginiamycin B lyase